MKTRLPTDLQSRWTQPNNSDKFGSVWATKCINFDEEGYVKSSPRTIRVMSEVASEGGDADFGLPVALGRYSNGNYQIMTTDQAFNGSLDATTRTFSENTSSDPTGTTDSHGCWFNSLWHASTNTAVLSKSASGGSGSAWTSRITGLTGSKRHYMADFASERTLCVTNGNVIKQVDTSYATTNITQLTIPADYEAIGLAYNSGNLGIITALGDGTDGLNIEAKFYNWDGQSNSAKGYGVGADACVAIVPYKSTFAILTRNGQLLYFNGGGLEQLAAFPFYYLNNIWGDFLNFISRGTSMWVEGDVIYINVGLELNNFGRKSEKVLPNCPSGVWCFDPKVGLYHRWAPSTSQARLTSVTSANVNTTTDVFTTSDTVPATGGVARFTNFAAGGNGITPLIINQDYYVIKLTSTTFKLATTRANAIAGAAIDITAVEAGSTATFWMYDLKDFSCTSIGDGDAGGMALTGETSAFVYQDIIFGTSVYDTSLSKKDGLHVSVPYLENRSWLITPKLYSSEVKDNNQKIVIKFRPLGSNDSIVVKHRDRDVYGLPTVSPNSYTSTEEFIWTSDMEGYTASDLSEAKTYIDRGWKLEIEFTAGAGGGVCAQITEINYSSGTYSLVLEESVLGAAAGLKSHFVIWNWEVKKVITSADTSPVEIPIGGVSSWEQFKIELRGYDVAIEEEGFVDIVNKALA